MVHMCLKDLESRVFGRTAPLIKCRPSQQVGFPSGPCDNGQHLASVYCVSQQDACNIKVTHAYVEVSIVWKKENNSCFKFGQFSDDVA